jgi:MFS family permease
LYAQQVLHASNFLYGLLLAVLATGSVLGGWLGGRLVTRFWWGAVLLGVCLAQAAAWTAIVIAESPGVTFAAFLLIGAGYTVTTVCVVATRQAEVPNAMLGRLVTGFRIIGNGASLFGALAGRLVAGQFGLVAAPWCAAASLTAVTRSDLDQPRPSPPMSQIGNIEVGVVALIHFQREHARVHQRRRTPGGGDAQDRVRRVRWRSCVCREWRYPVVRPLLQGADPRGGLLH